MKYISAILLLIFLFLSLNAKPVDAHGTGPPYAIVTGAKAHNTIDTSASSHQANGYRWQAHTIHIFGAGVIVIFFLGALIRQYMKNRSSSE
ncbi:MAG: hypothetical protein HY430_03725 [Candidatus Levybacteria bacterium]|nr:hypothetical protein [Candidatus Levybacteria bacterium]